MRFVFRDKIESEQYRSIIRIIFLDGKTYEEIKARLDGVYKDLSPSITTVRYCFNEFNMVVHLFLTRNDQAV